ncbi:unnamed protein product, partial [Closterium sp. Naga37s-1]
GLFPADSLQADPADADIGEGRRESSEGMKDGEGEGEEEEEEEGEEEPKQVLLWELVSSVQQLPPPVLRVLAVTALTWLAWFPFLLFDTDWMGREVFGGSSNPRESGLAVARAAAANAAAIGTEASAAASSSLAASFAASDVASASSEAALKAYSRGVRFGALGLVLNSVVQGATSLRIDALCRRFGSRTVWAVGNLVLAVCLLATAAVPSAAPVVPQIRLATAAVPSAASASGPTATATVSHFRQPNATLLAPSGSFQFPMVAEAWQKNPLAAAAAAAAAGTGGAGAAGGAAGVVSHFSQPNPPMVAAAWQTSPLAAAGHAGVLRRHGEGAKRGGGIEGEVEDPEQLQQQQKQQQKQGPRNLLGARKLGILESQAMASRQHSLLPLPLPLSVLSGLTTRAFSSLSRMPKATVAKAAALTIFAVLGAPMAVTYSLPFSLTASFTTRGGGGQGLAAGLLNIAIVLPQMFVSLVIGPFDAFFGGGNIPGFMAAAAFAAAAAAAAFFTLPRPPPDTPPPLRPSASRASLSATSIPHWVSPPSASAPRHSLSPSASAPRHSLSNPFRMPPLHTSAARPDPVSPLSLPTCVSPIPPSGIKDSCSRSQ